MNSTAKMPRLSLQVASSARGLHRVEKMLSTVKVIWNLGEEAYNRIRTAVSEAVKNAIEHGNKGDENKTVRIDMQRTGDSYRFTVEDEGQGFRAPVNEGKGIRLMKDLSSRINFDRNGSCVEMTFRESANS